MDDNHRMAVAATSELVGRESELLRLDDFVGGLEDGAAGLVICGEAGIGKTALLRAAIERAETTGVRVLATRCAEAEMPLALGGLADLVDTVLDGVIEHLPEFQGRALTVAVGQESPSDDVPDAIALPRAFLACLRVLAERSPILVAIDDVQWLDPASRRVVSFAARRLEDAPVGIVVTERADATDLLDLQKALPDSFQQVRVGPLSVGALHHVVRSRLGVRIPRPTFARVHRASGGNPLFALEFARAGADPAARPSVPASLEELSRERIDGFPAAIRPLLAAAAAAERPTVPLLARIVDDADLLLDQSVAVGALTIDGDLIRFSHPLFAAVIYNGLAPSARRTLHARLAAISDELERRARHLALAAVAPEPDVALLLDEAAAHARARGSPETAARLAEQALRLTPSAHAEEREERCLAVATYLADAGQVADARAQLDSLLAGPIVGHRRARALVLRSELEHDMEARRRMVEQALEHVGEDRALRARVLLAASRSRANWAEPAAAEALAREALAEAEQVDDPVLLATALATVALRATRPAPDLLERAIALSDVHGTLPRSRSPRLVMAMLQLGDGHLAEARELIHHELDAMRRSGRAYEQPQTLLLLAQLETAAGSWQEAESCLDEAWELAFDGGDRFWEAWASLHRALLAGLRGDVDEARRLADQGMTHAETHWPLFAAHPRAVLVSLELSLGNTQRAWKLLADLVDVELVWFALPAVADAIEAAVLFGRLEEAEAALAALLAKWPKSLWATPAGLRCRALIMLANGESDAALGAAEEAAAQFEEAGFPFDRGRSLLVAGEALRRLGERRRAGEKLEAAKAIFEELGAELWRERAEQELARAQPRRRSDGTLTAAEQRVAALVAAGRTNREVAAELFTTVGTVEVHLTRIYRKLGLRSRTELARRVAEGGLDLGGQ